MADRISYKADRSRWQRDIVRHLEEFPRQYAALESAMGAFGGEFDMQQCKEAFNTKDDMEAYNRVQAVERAVGRVRTLLLTSPMRARNSRYCRARRSQSVDP
jgi:hypothetical protein